MQIGITLEYPWALALLPVLAVFIVITGKSLKVGTALKRRIILTLRLLLISVLILAIASPTIIAKANKTATIFLADSSDSIRDMESSMDAFIEKALSHQTKRDVSGVIAFANESVVANMPNEDTVFSGRPVRLHADGTNIEKAMILARSIMPENIAKRLVLLTDGKETSGDAIDTARLLKRLGYTVDVVPFATGTKPEVQVEEFNAPKQVNAKERFDVTVKINSNATTRATIRLFGNRTLTAEKEVDLYPGENLFTFSDTVEQSGMVTYTAEVFSNDDTVLQNNQLSAFTEISDHPSILLVEKGRRGENMVGYIEQYASVTRVQPDEVPLSMQGMLAYDAFVLVDISAGWLDPMFLDLLEQAVQHQGKGLLTIGGENSYAPGDYRNTPLETILPVDMDIRPKEENPDLGLILVIDKSGSMASGEYGITKLELAKEAAIRAAEVLEEKDQLGVIAFDDAIQWVIPTEQLTDRDAAMEQIATIRPGGGTQILHPLEEAWQNLRDKNTKLKHIILLTDGQAERYGYERVIDGLRVDGITLSTVAVGEGADTLLLKALAYGGQGRYYQTDEFTDIPSIFAKEAFLAGQKYLQNRQFYPELVSSMGLLKGIEAVPSLDGYVATRIKASASLVFRSDIQDPVLAVWQYGLGRTAAWTSDIQGIWTSQWAMWQDAPLFWGNLVSWMVQKNLNSGYTIETEIVNGKGVITLSADNESTILTDSVQGTLVAPDGSKETLQFNAIRPGVYQGTIAKTDQGAYVAHIEVPDNGDVKNISTGVVMPYSHEYRVLNMNAQGFMEKLAQAGGGRIVTEPEAVFQGPVQNLGSKRELTTPLIILLLILLLLDIAFRKLQIRLDKVVLFWNERISPFFQRLLSRLKPKKRSTAPVTAVNPPIEEAVEPTSQHTIQPKVTAPMKKSAEPKNKEQSTGNDHVNALLNRRKQWK